MKSCTRKILLFFGLLMILVMLFIPYRSVHVKFKQNPYTQTRYKMTTHQSGYMFVLKFLKLKPNETSNSEIDQDSYFLNKTLFLIEMIIIIVLAPFDYALFCVVIKKKEKTR